MLKDFCDSVCDQSDRVEWLKARRHGVGASEAAGVLGASPWSSGISVFADKVDPSEPEERDSERLALGHVLEPVILAHYEKITGREACRAGDLLRSKRWPFMLATLDGVTQINGETAVLEIKNTQDRSGWSDGVPRHVWIQVQQQMAVTGYKKASVAVLIEGCEFKTCDVLRDDEFIEKALAPDLEHFWSLVEKGGPPPHVDGSEASRDALKRLYINDSGAAIVLSGAFTNLSEERLELKDRIKRDTARVMEIENMVKAEIGEGKATFAATQHGGEFSWKSNKHGARTLRYKEPRGV